MSTATTTKLTETEAKVVKAAHDGKIKFSDGVKAESQVWEHELLTTLHDDLLLANASAKRVINSLIKKELIIRLETEEDPDAPGNMLELTDLFIDAVHDLDIEEEDDASDDDVPEVTDEDADLIIEDDDNEDEAPPTTMVQAAARKAKRKADTADLKKAAVADGKASRRTSHANCDHATQGSEGKKARAKCRKERAAAEAAKAEKAKK